MMRELRSRWPLCLAILILCASCCCNHSEARHHRQKPTAVVVGAIYCDTCFQDDTSKGSHYISGATVAVECAKESTRPAFQKEVKTDKQGKFKVELPFSVSKHVKKIEGCTVKLVKSSEPNCAVASTATSSLIHLKRRSNHQHIFSAGFFTFKPLKQPGVCNQQPSVTNSQLDSIKPDPATPTLPKPNTPNLPNIPPLPSLPPTPPRKTPYSKESEVDQPQQLFPPIVPPAFTPPQGPFPLPPNPLQPPGLLPNPLQPPAPPLIPNPLQPPTPPPSLLPPTPPLPNLPLPPTPGLTPPVPTPSPGLLPPTPPLPKLPLPPVPGLTPPPIPTPPPASSLPIPPIIPVPPGIGGSPLIPGVPPLKPKKVNHP